MKTKYDLILVGTGFASSFFLKKYLEKSGPDKKVLVLERGQQYTHKDRLLTRKGQPASFVDKLETSESTFFNSSPSKPWMFDVNFGGSSNCWWACTPRFMPNDFRLQSLYGRGQDWPLSYDDLESYYCEAEDIMSISGPEQTPFPRTKPYPLAPHVLNEIDRKMQKAFGPTQWISQPSGRPSRAVGARSMCCSGYTCNLCPVDAKFSVQNSLSYLYKDPRVVLQHGLQVYAVEFEGNTARKVLAAPTHSDPGDFRSEAFEGEVIALGANAIFNAHILLNSGDSNPLTGAGLNEQQGIFADIFLGSLDNVGGSSAITANGFMLYDGNFRKDFASCLIENHNCPTLIRNEFGKWRKVVRWKFVFEAISENKNRVTTGTHLFKPVVNYIMPADQYIEKGKTSMSDQLERLVAPLEPEEIFIDKNFQNTEFHVLSTVKMGKSIQDSVVDKHCVHHQYRNLFILGGSSFASISAANPTLTISAISLMSADKNF